MRGKKRTRDRDHHDRSFQKLRSEQSNMLRGSYRPGHNQPGRGFRGGGRSYRMDLPGPTISVGTRTDYSVGPWGYSACATRHLMA
jgi:hypothetical protein